MLKDIRSGKFTGILTWAPDRIARNAGDLGAVVDLMDQKLLLEIRTYGQRFTDSPNEKFLLMILGSQAKLENDARGVNVKQAQLQRDQIVRETKEFSFTKLFTCGLCGSGISAEEKFKALKGGGTNRYVYYGCSRARDRNCKNKYIREEELIEQIIKILDKVNINELGMKMKLEEDIRRFNKLQSVIGGKAKISDEVVKEADIRKYAKHLLREGSATEKRELLANLRSRLIYKNKTLSLAD